jgi:subtilisin family serine protease
MRRLIYYLFLGLFLIFSAVASANEVRRGERPLIDLERVPDEAMEAGRLRLKMHASVENLLDVQPVHVNQKGEVIFGIASVDALNRKYGVLDSRQTFDVVLSNKSFNERHRAWEFHLWYDLKMDSQADIRQMISEYMALPEVAFAEPMYYKDLIGHVEDMNQEYVIDRNTWVPNDPQYGSQWHYHNTGQQSGTPGKDIKLQGAWAIERGNPNVIIAVIDGGIAINHPDLAGNMWSGTGFNFVNNTPNIEPHNHGAHVAGTIAAVNNNNIGVSGIAGGWGSNPGVSLMSLQVFAATTSGGFAQAPAWGADNGAAISQNSWGYRFQNTFEQAVLDAIDYFNVNGGGTVMNGGLTIFAAGNSNAGGNWYPGIYSGAMAVAATNNQDKKAWYSNHDTWVEISAPGGETNTVTQRGVLSTITGNGYDFYQGTSMACPHVTGAAALVLSKYPDVFSANELRQILIHSADDHYGENPTFIGRLGSGRLNAQAALELAPVFLLMPKTPTNFQATVNGTTQIDVSWTQNQNNDDILLVYSQQPTIGSPVNGTVYSAGDILPGGGTVIVAGNHSTFQHTGLNPGDYYYYRIWSRSSDSLYSLASPTILAITNCELFTQLPFLETFPVSMTPACWQVIDNQSNGQIWQFGSFSAGLAGGTAPYAFLNSDAYGSGNTQNSDLVSPVFDLSGYSEVELSFTHFYRSHSSSAAKLFLSINGGETWEQLQQWTTTTSNPASVNIGLEQAAGSSSVRFKWNFTGTYGWYWCIDNVNLTGVLNIPGAPTVNTLAATEVGTDYATLHGELINSGDSPVISSGFVVSLNPNPTVGGSGVLEFNTGPLSQPGTFQFQATALESSKRYYVRAFAQNAAALMYGPQVQLMTICDIVNLPFFEGFDVPEAPYCWQIIDNQGNGQVWQVGTFSSGLAGGSGNYAYLNSDGFGSGNSQNSDLISPVILLTGEDAVEISFTHYFRQWSSSAGRFFYSLNAGANWTQAQVWTGATTPNPSQYSLQLNDLSGNEQLMLRWNYTGTYGYSWSVDNVQVVSMNITYYDLEISHQGQGSTIPAPGVHQFAQGETLNLTATAAQGWKFVKWVVDAQEYLTAQVQITMNSSKQAVAHFLPLVNYTLEVQIQGQGTTVPQAGIHTFTEGQNIMIQAVPAHGWEFDKWVVDGQEYSNTQVQVSMSANKVAVAHFSQIPEYILTIEVEGQGTTTPAAGQHSFPNGTIVNLSAVADQGWEFVKWIINSSTDVASPEHDMNITEDFTAKAIFSEIIPVYTVIIGIDGEGTVNPPAGEYQYDEGSSFQISAEASQNWVFSKWVINGQDISENPYFVTVSQSLQIMAYFLNTVNVPITQGDALVRVYPNPASGEFYVELLNFKGDTEVSLIDLQGRSIARQHIGSQDVQVVVFSSQGLKHGIYLVRVVSSKGVELKKLIIQ